MSDGFERSYDHYVGWALHLYPVLWARMQGAAELAAGRTASDVAALDRFLLDAVALVGADGSPLIQGRSLIYRFAAAAPFWIGVIAEVPSLSAGRLRHAAEPHRRPLRRQRRSRRATASSRWAGTTSGARSRSPTRARARRTGRSRDCSASRFRPTTRCGPPPSEPLPVEAGDTLRAVRAAGWIVSGTHDDGIVRVVNHGTDHAAEGSLVGDSPLYARIGYSTATSPLARRRPAGSSRSSSRSRSSTRRAGDAPRGDDAHRRAGPG